MSQIKKTLCVLTIAAASCAATTAQAAPVTLAFEAEIVRVFDTVPFDTGVTLEVGDTVVGRFTFWPDEVGGGNLPGRPTTFESQQDTSAFIKVNGVEFSTADNADGITIRSFNNASGTLFGENDLIDIGSQLEPIFPNSMLGVTSAGLAIFLQGDSEVLPGAIIPADPAIWNQLINFDDRIRLTLRNNDGGRVGFTAEIEPGSFVVVPEPSTANSAAAFLFAAFIKRSLV